MFVSESRDDGLPRLCYFSKTNSKISLNANSVLPETQNGSLAEIPTLINLKPQRK